MKVNLNKATHLLSHFLPSFSSCVRNLFLQKLCLWRKFLWLLQFQKAYSQVGPGVSEYSDCQLWEAGRAARSPGSGGLKKKKCQKHIISEANTDVHSVLFTVLTKLLLLWWMAEHRGRNNRLFNRLTAQSFFSLQQWISLPYL